MAPKTPFLAVDAIIQVFEGERFLGIVLVERKNPPLGKALPGGFVDYGESVEDAILREVREETGLTLSSLRQFHAYSRPERDPRRHVVSVVFLCKAEGIPRGGNDALEAKIYPLEEIPFQDLVFDHREIIQDYLDHRY